MTLSFLFYFLSGLDLVSQLFYLRIDLALHYPEFFLEPLDLIVNLLGGGLPINHVEEIVSRVLFIVLHRLDLVPEELHFLKAIYFLNFLGPQAQTGVDLTRLRDLEVLVDDASCLQY